MSAYPLLSPSETLLEGKWIASGGEITANNTSRRIEFLITNVLVQVTADDSGWMVLYQDIQDDRYWELSYPHSSEHGGGAPILRYLDSGEIHRRYKII